MKVDENTLQWPPPEDKIVIKLKRSKGAYGRAYAQWSVKSPSSEDSDTEGDILEDWFDKCSGDVQIPAGEEDGIVKIPVHTRHGDMRVIPPKNPLEFDFEIICLTPGVVVNENEKVHRFSVNPPSNRPGEITFNDEPVVVKQSDKVAEIPLIRQFGSNGYLEVDYTLVDGTAKSGKHYVGVTIDTIKFYDGETEKNIVIPKTYEIYKDNKSFKVELKDARNGGELGDVVIKEVELLSTFVEPPGKLNLPKYLNNDKKFSSNTSDKVVIPIERSGGKGGDVSINVKTQDHTAKAGEHFEAFDEVVTLSDGQTKTQVEIPLIKSRYKNKIGFNVLLTNPEGGLTLGKTTLNVKLNPTITEPPGEVTLPTDAYEIVVDTKDKDKITIPIVRKNGNGGDITVVCETKDLSAKDGTHYSGIHKAKYTIKDLEDGCDIDIPLLAEKYRKNKEFLVKLSNPQGGAKIKGAKEKKVILKANDTEPCGELELMESIKANANNKDIIKVPITRVNGTGGTMCVHYQTKNGSATAGQHYKQISGVLKMQPGDDYAELEIPVVKSVYKKDLNFKILFDKVKGEETITSPLSCAVELLHTYEEPPGVLSLPTPGQFKDISANKNDVVVIPISRGEGQSGEVSVHVRTSDGTAIAGKHYIDMNDQITFHEGQDKADVKVRLIQARYKDGVDFDVTISDPDNGATLGKRTSLNIILQPTITEPPGVLNFLTEDILIDCSKSDLFVIPIQRLNGNGGDVQCHFATKDISAKSGIHYEAVEQDVTIDDLTNEANVTIPLKSSSFRKDLEFAVVLTEPEGGVKIREPSEKRIILMATDTEPCGTLQLPEDIKFCANDGDKVKIPIERMNGTGGVLSAKYKTKPGSAQPGKHYEEVEGILEINPGESTQFIEIPVIKEQYSKDIDFSLIFDKTDSDDTIEDRKEYNIHLVKTFNNPPGSLCLLGNDYDIYASAQENTHVKIPVCRVGGSGGDVCVKYKTKDNSAVGGKHFHPQEGTLVFTDEDDEPKTIDIELVNTKYRRDLKFHVELCDCTGGADISRELACVYLKRTDDRQTGEIKFPPNSALEVSANKRNSLFIPVKRVGGDGGEVDIHYKTEDKTAKSGIHFISCAGVMKLKDGQIEGGFEIPLLKDNYRNSLHFAVHLNHSTEQDDNVTNELQVNLLPTDTAKPGVLGFEKDEKLEYSPLEHKVANITLNRKDGCDGVVKFDFKTRNFSAVEGVHFLPLEGSGVMPDKCNELDLEIPLITTAEFTRPVAFEVVVTPTETPEGMSTGVLNKTVTLLPTLKDPVGVFGFEQDHYKCSAIDSNVIEIPIKRSEGTGGKVSIDYFTRDNTAIAGSHYEESVGVITFEDGEATQFIQIPVSTGAEYDKNLTFGLELGGTSEGDDIVTVYETEIILEPTVVVTSSSSSSSSSSSESSYSESEDPGVLGFSDVKYEFSARDLAERKQPVVATIPVQRTESNQGKVSVDYFTRDNAAVAGVHYKETQGKLVFKNGEDQKVINVPLNKNASYWEPVSFTAELGATSRNADVTIYETEVVLKPTSDKSVSQIQLVCVITFQIFVHFRTSKKLMKLDWNEQLSM